MKPQILITHDADALCGWIAAHHPGVEFTVGRPVGQSRSIVLRSDTAALDAIRAHNAVLSLPAPIAVTEPPSEPAIERAIPVEQVCAITGGTRPRLQVYTRKAISWLSTRSWSSRSKKSAVAALKGAKLALDPVVIDGAAADIAETMARQIGHAGDIIVTHVACGHSRRPDCFACRLAERVAERLGLPFRKVFGDRFVKGVSHPKEFAKLDPIAITDLPSQSLVLVVDDVATSGWHIEEALTTLRSAGKAAIGVTWISGEVDK